MTNTDAARALMSLTQDWAVLKREGEPFRLSSGILTNYYFDAKRVMLTPQAFMLIGQLVYEHAKRVGAVAVGGLAAGCIPMADAALAYACTQGDMEMRTFFVRPEKKEHGTQELLFEGHYSDPATGKDEPLIGPGRRVLVVDDVLTTGDSMQKAIDEITRRGAQVVSVLVLVDRMAPQGQAFRDRQRSFKSLFNADNDGNLSLALEPVLA